MNAKIFSMGKHKEHVHWEGEAKFASEADMQVFLKRKWPVFGRRLHVEGWKIEPVWKDLKVKFHPRPNLVVNVGIARSLDNLFVITGTSPAPSPAGTAVLRIGVDNASGATDPAAGSLSSNSGGGTDTGASTRTLRTFNSAATRTGQVATCSGTFNDVTTAGIGAVGFIMKRLFLSANASNITNTTTADTNGSLYSMTNRFTIDFTGISTWSLVFTATVTGVGA